jgi:hypothetical protein
VLLGEALDVLPKGLVGPLLAVAEIPRVLGSSVRTLEVTNEDGAKVTPVADVARLELLKPSSGRA